MRGNDSGGSMGKNSVGASHKIHHFIARDMTRLRGERAATFAPGTRVTVRSLEGVPNGYAGRFGEVVEEAAVDGEAAYHVLLDVYLPGEEAGQPIAFFAGELRPTSVPKPSA